MRNKATIGILLMSAVLYGQAEDNNTILQLSDLRESIINEKLIGDLGLPLGSVARIKARVINGGEHKGDPDYKIHIISINDKRVDKKMAYSVKPWVKSKLGNGIFDTYYRVTGNMKKEITKIDRETIDAEYRNLEFSLLVYEIVEIRGYPGYTISNEFSSWDERGYFLYSRVEVVKDLSN